MEDTMTQQDKSTDKFIEHPIKDFDAVAWTRARREELYRKYQDAPPEEFVRRLSEEGKATDLWKALTERHRRPGEAA